MASRRPRATARRTPPQPAASPPPPRRGPVGRYGSGPSRSTRVLLWVAVIWAVLLAIALAAVVLASLRHLSAVVGIAGGLGVGALLALANVLRRAATRH